MSEIRSGRSSPRPRLPGILALSAVVLVVALLAYGLTTTAAETGIDQSLSEGEAPPAPSFELPVLEAGAIPRAVGRGLQPDLADGELGLAELEGTPFVLNFWASWCDPCREEVPILEAGWRRHGRRGVLYLGLNMQDATGDARGFLEEFGISYPTIREQGNEVARSYGATGLPETYFVSARGRVVSHVIGVVTPEQLDDGVRGAKAGRVVGALSGGARKPQR
jgi:cytochrome c biogenesis protein CcmG/thiol:disulfide interchange protein DsbE